MFPFKTQKVSLRQTVNEVLCAFDIQEESSSDENSALWIDSIQKCLDNNRRTKRTRRINIQSGLVDVMKSSDSSVPSTPSEAPRQQRRTFSSTLHCDPKPSPQNKEGIESGVIIEEVPLSPTKSDPVQGSSKALRLHNVKVSPTASFKRKNEKIMKAVQLSEETENLIGDYTKPYALPLDKEAKHSDLKTITPETLAQLICGKYSDIIDTHTIIDGRFPYEDDGGHIQGAINIYDRQSLLKHFFDRQDQIMAGDSKSAASKASSSVQSPSEFAVTKRHILVFHCEFSSQRGPGL